jgi:hypothetical protein
MRISKAIGLIAFLAMTVSVTAQGIPGKTRPIRVGMFKGTGTNAYWHTNMHTAGANIAQMLSGNTARMVNMGTGFVLPDSGFKFTQYGLASGQGTPTEAQTNAFIAALDTLDVAIISCVVKLGSVFTTTTQRDALVNFWRNKGYIAIHASTDSKNSNWSAIDSMHGAQFANHPSGDRNATLHLDSAAFADNEWKYLNAGLTPGLTPGTGDTARFVEEWFSFETGGSAIRSTPNLKVTVRIDEASYAGGLGGARALGADHPMSWYRKTPGTKGRFFYTAVGHRAQNYDSLGPTPFLRRQIYNAILWTARYDTATTTSLKYAVAPGQFGDYSKLSFAPSKVTITMTHAGRHSVELVGLDGKRLAFRNGDGAGKSYTFDKLLPGVYALSLQTSAGRSNRLVNVQ